ncbi:hypothetical protein [Tahibacter caeni]|uniref:hypothetical protein n=1 Tax=Tahibacter caeni TaxID=1453545 RepID=UPI002147D0B0|nr:hypothetical protein [Tahibacter caeni]
MRLRVPARQHFTPVMDVTGGRRYALAAARTWRDWFIVTDAQGYASRGLQRWFERRRLCPDQPWFALCGVIAAAGADDGALRAAVRAHALPWTRETRDGEPWRAPGDGRLYVFPNDVYAAFWNNSGQLDLVVTELAETDTGAG